ncbi:hypothetical protein SCG7086_AG_00050 [Chlamydiales bacterium SCGC AG-110-P3]|nr:hypothetical protein SCG7086_AG_00050 [Chlamydiales bacterium SCGC AG-110-P3]
MRIDEEGHHIAEYGEHEVEELEDTPVPLFLKIMYVFITFVGLAALATFWNGSAGYFDRGYWKELQVAAGTTRTTDGELVPRPGHYSEK